MQGLIFLSQSSPDSVLYIYITTNATTNAKTTNNINIICIFLHAIFFSTKNYTDDNMN